ncbi:MAG: type I polyketide synthase, partial [Chloroflexota bacterium]
MEHKPVDYIGTEIAVIGMACRLPGAHSPQQFWENIRDGVESIERYCDDELLAEGVNAQTLSHPNYIKAGAPLDGIKLFDAHFFGMGPKEAAVMDPQHRQFLEVTWEALEHSGYDPDRFPGSIGVYGGSGHNLYLPYNILTNQKLMDAEGFFLLRHTGNDKDFLTTRVSYAFNLRGPSVNVQTACSTSLVAIHLASQALLNAECDMALAGGVTLEMPHRQGYFYKEGEILSSDGHCRPFDASAGGTVFGSGAGVVVLKRLEDALSDGDTIHAIILGSAINNDGAHKASYLAPSPEGQALVIDEALGVADVSPETIDYIETHGTGTALGDPIEIQGLTQAFGRSTHQKGCCALGSVKANIGHLDTAAGVAGFIKTVMALKHQQLPPILNFARPNPLIPFDESPFYVNKTLSKWEPSAHPRRAGISSLGVGGTNAHVVLQEGPTRGPSTPSRRLLHLFPVSAVSIKSLEGNIENLRQMAAESEAVDLADIAYTLQHGRKAFSNRAVVVAQSHADLATALEKRPVNQLATQLASDEAPKLIFTFPGGGAQYPNMGRDLYVAEPVYRQALDRCFDILKRRCELDLKPMLFPEYGDEANAQQVLKRPLLALPAVLATEYALSQLWGSWGIRPEMMIGHSMGEYTAALLAGVFTLEDALSLVVLRGQLFESLPEGGMVSVNLSEGRLLALFGESGLDDLVIGVMNNPDFCVVSGPVASLERLTVRLG